jgi:putative transport protein
MLDLARDIIGSQPILTIFLTIGLGYLVGQISIGGFALGVGAVLFVGVAIGAFAPKAQIIGPIGLTGLIMFLYGIGILYGRQFFEGMVGVGRKYNLLALIACIASLFVALGLGKIFDVKIGHTLGIYAGSMTSTAALQAALDAIANKDPSIGYSVAYPFGVIGPILCIYFMTRIVNPKFPAKAQRFHMGEISIGATSSGRALAELMKELPSDVQVTMVRKDGHNFVPTDDTVLSIGDAVLLIAEREEALKEAAARLGKPEPGLLASDRTDLDYIRVFVGKANVVGVPLSGLAMPPGFPAHILHVRRYDADLVPSPDLMLEFGDRVGVLMPPARKDEIRKFFGDTVKAAAEFSYVSLGIGMVLGSLGLVLLVFFSHHLDMNEGRIGLSILNTAVAKIQPDVVTLFFKGTLCNVLVCLAVWLAYAGRSVTDKILALILPVSAFVAAGFEHCVANMYFLPLAWLLTQTGNVPTDFDASSITISGIIHNLVPVTIGNIVGGAGLVGVMYWTIYRAAFGAMYLGEK